MNNIQEAIELLGVMHNDVPNTILGKALDKIIALLEIEPEPGEFTRECEQTLLSHENDPELQWTTTDEKLREACKKIDRLTAELSFTKQELGAANVELKVLKDYDRKLEANEVVSVYQAELKVKVAEIVKLEQELSTAYGNGYKAGQVSKES